MGKEEREKFMAKIKYDVGNSKNGFEKAKYDQKNTDEEDPYKEERERARGEYARKQSRKVYYEMEIKNTIPPCFREKPQEGKKLSVLVEKLLHLESEFLDIGDPNYLFYRDRETEDDYGYYEDETDTIHINLEWNTSFWELFDTVIHELRHKYQNMAMENPEKYPEMREITAKYLKFSQATYPDDERNSDYEEDYRKNGLETDAFAYAAGRMSIYLEQSKTPDEVLDMKIPVKRIVKNQILMDSGDISPSGVRAPINVSNTFTEKEFLEYRNNRKKGGENNMGQGTGATDFSEEAQRGAAKVYGRVIEDIQSFSEKMIHNLTERIKTHPYKQMENVVNTFIYYYNEKLPGEIKVAISEWIQSENSFASSLRKHEEDGSSASISAAEKLQESLKEKVDEAFKQMDPVKIELAVNVDKERIIRDAQYTESYFKELQNLRNSWIEQFQRYSEQNSLFINMASLVVDTFKHVEKIYQAAQKDILKVGDEFAQAWSGVVDYGTTFSMERTKVERNISDLFTTSRKRH